MTSDFMYKTRVLTNLKYPRKYKGLKSIPEQVKTIASLFWLDGAQALQFANNLPPLPKGAEGYCAIPSIDAVTKKFFPDVKNFDAKYRCVVNMSFDLLSHSRSVWNDFSSWRLYDSLSLQERTISSLEVISKTQKDSDILIIPVQHGLLHKGCSNKFAREHFAQDEFGMGGFHVACLALTHPERYVKGSLGASCPGDMMSPHPGIGFLHSTLLFFNGHSLIFGHNMDMASEFSAPVTAFIPQA